VAEPTEAGRGVDPSRRPSILDKQYTLIENAPPPMSWDDYSERVSNEWNALLDSSDAGDEAKLQEFVEGHPSLLMGVAGAVMGRRTPFPGALISQPPLRGVTTKFPDFLWITFNSMILQPALIEIETPIKRWFNRSNELPSGDLVQALDQIGTWRAWFEEDVNRAWFLDYYEIPDDVLRGKMVQPRYVLIIGRNSEFASRRDLNLKRSSLPREGERLMTFDRLAPDYSGKDVICARKTDRGYSAISVPATLTLHPSDAEWFAKISDKPGAAARNPWLTTDRRDFLIERFPYWDGRVAANALGVISGHGE
jgi:Shedu protein SduA, C-terminal